MQRLTRDALLMAAVCCGLVVAFVPIQPLRVLAAVPLVLVLPGAACARALFREGLNWPERLLLTLGLSAPLVAIAALVVDAVGIPLERGFWALAAVGVVAACSVVAFVQRRPALRRKRTASPQAFDLIVILVAVEILVGAVGLSVIPLKAPAGTPGYTALWLQPSGGSTATAVVSSAELESAKFRLVVATHGRVLTRRSFSLPPGGRRRFRVPVGGSSARVVAVLHRLGARVAAQRVELTLGSGSGGRTAAGAAR